VTEDRKTAFLSQIPIFSDLRDKDLADFAAMTSARKMKKGEMVFHEGDNATGFYIVALGRVKVFKDTPDGREQILHIISPGETFAEVALFSGSAYPANAQALEDSEVYYVPREGLVALIGKDPQLSLNIMAGFARWVRQFNRLLSEYTKAVPSRLAGYLLAEGLRQHPRDLENGARIRLPISKTEIAALLGTISATLSRAFAGLREEGIIETADRDVVISDLDGLRDLASGTAGEGGASRRA
jgi:CRP/FNR family transcriptional regulator